MILNYLSNKIVIIQAYSFVFQKPFRDSIYSNSNKNDKKIFFTQYSTNKENYSIFKIKNLYNKRFVKNVNGVCG